MDSTAIPNEALSRPQTTREDEPEVTSNERDEFSRLDVRSVRDTFANPPVPPEPLIKDLISKGEMVVIGGPRGAFKSWFAMDLARLMAKGDGLLLDKFPVLRPCRVLFAHGELDDATAYPRWKKLVGESEPPEGLFETFDDWHIRVVRRRETTGDRDQDKWSRVTNEFMTGILDGRLAQAIVDFEIEVLIIDPWAVFYTGKESDNDELEAALSELRKLARELGVVVVIIHHFSKAASGGDPEDKWRGATRLPDWASLRMTIDPYYTAKAAKNAGMSRAQARRFAWLRFLARRDETPPDLLIRFDTETGWWNAWKDAPPVHAEGRRTEFSLQEIAAACAGAGDTWPSISKAAEDLGCSQTVAKRELGKATEDGILKRSKGARGAIKHRLTDRGRDLASDRGRSYELVD